MARDCTDGRFREVVERCGGPEHVLLVGELWDRTESRALLESFLRALFPGQSLDGGGAPRCVDHQQTKPATDRSVCFSLVFFLCRAESLRLPCSRRQLQEILRDVRERTPGRGAVVGVIMRPECPEQDSVTGREEEREMAHPDCQDVSSLLELLRSVFIPGRGRWPEFRAAALLQGQEESRREVQRVACEAITAAADVKTKWKKQRLLGCLAWCRRGRRKDLVIKEHPEEGTALTVLNHPNGDCTENSTDV
ncbi:uncharacterized protein C2orf72 homolog [Pelodytes ibericus]